MNNIIYLFSLMLDTPLANKTRELKRLDCYCCDGYAILRNYDVIKTGKHKGKKCYAGSRYDWEGMKND